MNLLEYEVKLLKSEFELSRLLNHIFMKLISKQSELQLNTLGKSIEAHEAKATHFKASYSGMAKVNSTVNFNGCKKGIQIIRSRQQPERAYYEQCIKKMSSIWEIK